MSDNHFRPDFSSCSRWAPARLVFAGRVRMAAATVAAAALVVPFPGVPRAVRSPNLSGSPARGSEGRRFPAAGGMGRSHGAARRRPPSGFFGGNRRESRWPRGLAWPARPHVWPAPPAAAGGAGNFLLREWLHLGEQQAQGSPALPSAGSSPGREQPGVTLRDPAISAELTRTLIQWRS